ncbi:MAG: lactate racemase domain-containing protein, partial [Saccharofermentanales bacterium]
MKKEIQFDYCKSRISFNVDSRNILSEIRANEVAYQKTGLDEVKRALENPIGTPRLSEIVSKGESVCIVTSDITRPCPSHIMLPPVIEELMNAGISTDDITVVFALGSHRRHTEEEKRILVGDYIYELVHTIDSDPEDT